MHEPFPCRYAEFRRTGVLSSRLLHGHMLQDVDASDHRTLTTLLQALHVVVPAAWAAVASGEHDGSGVIPEHVDGATTAGPQRYIVPAMLPSSPDNDEGTCRHTWAPHLPSTRIAGDAPLPATSHAHAVGGEHASSAGVGEADASPARPERATRDVQRRRFVLEAFTGGS